MLKLRPNTDEDYDPTLELAKKYFDQERVLPATSSNCMGNQGDHWGVRHYTYYSITTTVLGHCDLTKNDASVCGGWCNKRFSANDVAPT